MVGPEAPLAAGVVDVLEEAGLPTFGPIRAAARIEWSKAFCRDVAAAAGVRMACGEAFWAHKNNQLDEDIVLMLHDAAGKVIELWNAQRGTHAQNQTN